MAGKAYGNYDAGVSVIKVQYTTTDIQESYVECQVGGMTSDSHNTKGCLVGPTGDLKVGNQDYSYTYEVVTDNNNGRTISGFSTGARDKMRVGCKGCPYTDFQHCEYFFDCILYCDLVIHQCCFEITCTKHIYTINTYCSLRLLWQGQLCR